MFRDRSQALTVVSSTANTICSLVSFESAVVKFTSTRKSPQPSARHRQHGNTTQGGHRNRVILSSPQDAVVFYRIFQTADFFSILGYDACIPIMWGLQRNRASHVGSTVGPKMRPLNVLWSLDQVGSMSYYSPEIGPPLYFLVSHRQLGMLWL